jgi:choline dehydrogenase
MAQSVYHAAGTNAMGKKNDIMSVIDSQARVFGVSRLRAVDASGFSVLPPGHPQSTVCKVCRYVPRRCLEVMYS